MPNWVYNSLTAEGSAEDISVLKQTLNAPFTRVHETYDMEAKEMQLKTYSFSNPVFAFWNIVKPTDMETYQLQEDPKHNKSIIDFKGNNWYDWNVRNWGTKWDVAVSDDSKYNETELVTDSEDTLVYRFDTAWSPPIPAIEKLSEMFPNIEFDLEYEEETGWGGNYLFLNGDGTETESYENKCRDCDLLNTLDYCENECGEICSSCNYMGEADLEAVAECEVHNEYLPID
jgi:hypothetical protein